MQNRVLKQGEVLSLTMQKGEALRGDTGLLWLTFEGQSEDVFLESGQVWQAPHGGKVVLQAMESGSVRQIEAPPSTNFWQFLKRDVRSLKAIHS